MPYYLSILLALLLGLVVTSSRASSMNLVLSVLGLFAASIFVGLRDVSVGQDTVSYISIFDDPASYTDYIEPGFIYYNMLIGALTDSGTAFLVIHALIVNLVLYAAYRCLVGDRAILAMAILMATHVYWLMQIQLLRNGFAAALFLLCALAAIAGRKTTAALAGSAAVLIHYTAAIPLAVWAVARALSQGRRRSAVVRLLIAAIAAYLLFDIYTDGRLNVLFEAYFNKIEGNIYSSTHGEMIGPKFGFQYLPGAVIVFFGALNWRLLPAPLRDAFAVYLGVALVSFLTWDITLFRDRIFLFAQVFEPLLLLMLGEHLGNRSLNLALTVCGICAWSYGVVFLWGPNNLLTHY